MLGRLSGGRHGRGREEKGTVVLHAGRGKKRSGIPGKLLNSGWAMGDRRRKYGMRAGGEKKTIKLPRRQKSNGGVTPGPEMHDSKTFQGTSETAQ